MFNINGIEWLVIWVPATHPKLKTRNGTFAFGSCDNSTHTIYLSSSIPKHKIKKVLSHEITHAAMFSYNVYMPVDYEEIIADLISTYGEEIVFITNKIFKKIRGSR